MTVSQIVSLRRREKIVEPTITDLDALSNSVLDAIEAHKYDEAEKLCQKLLLEYPEVCDGPMRMAEIQEARGRFQEAARNYSKVLEIMSQQAGLEEAITEMTQRRDRALAKAKQ